MNIIDIGNWHNLLNKMIIISGSARSGTTIMGKLIHSLENVEYLFEPAMLCSILLKQDELKEESLKELLQFYFFDNFLIDSLAGRNINLNKHDDSCILNVKSEEEINKRYERSLGRVELEKIVERNIVSFKSPDIVFFLEIMRKIFPKNRTIIMYREPNYVINSLIRKKWFSDEYLSEKHLNQVFAVEIINTLKVPYWVKNEDKEFWIRSNELNRCAYYYKRISEEIFNNVDNSILVNYDKFIKKPTDIFSKLVKSLDLKYGEKTEKILSTVKYQEKKRDNLLVSVENTLKEELINFEQILSIKSI